MNDGKNYLLSFACFSGNWFIFYSVAVVVLVSDFKFPDYLHNKIAHRGIE